MQGRLSATSLELVNSLLYSERAPLYDFTRCVRPNGTAYGTGGRCRKGVESALSEDLKRRGRPRKVQKPLSEMSPTEKRAHLDKTLRETVRSLRKGDPEELKRIWVSEHNKGKIPKEYPSSLRMAKDVAKKRVKGGGPKESQPKEERKEPKVHPELKAPLEKLNEAYDKIADLKKQNLPSGEKWRIEDAENELWKAKVAAKKVAEGLGLTRDFEKRDWEGFARSRSQSELQSELGHLHYEIIVNRQYPDRAASNKELEQKALVLVRNIQDPTEKAKAFYQTGIHSGSIKQEKPGNLNATLRAGKQFLSQYDEGLRSTVSIIRRANKFEESLRALSKKVEEEKEPGWIKRKLRIASALMLAARHRGNAEARLRSKMEGIRRELLKTKLSEEQVKLLTDRVYIAAPPGGKKADPGALTNARANLEEFVRMFNGKGLKEVQEEGGKRDQLMTLILDPNSRAYAYSRSGFVTTNGRRDTLFHEIGHIIEGQRDWIADYANRWRDSRAFPLEKAQSNPISQQLVGDGKTGTIPHTLITLPTTRQTVPLVKFDDMLPLKGKGYKPEEVALVDTYLSPYLGKKYGDQMTEIVSSTLEHFAEPHLMAHLYKNHPDLFTLGVGLASD